LLLENQFIEIKWNKANKKHYINKGYKFTNINDTFSVKAEDLTTGSNKHVFVVCDHCELEYVMQYSTYRQSIDKFGEIRCRKCSAVENAKRTLKERQSRMYKNIVEICKSKNATLLTEEECIANNQSEVYYICNKHGKMRSRVVNLMQGKWCYKCGQELTGIKVGQYNKEERVKKLYSKLLYAANCSGYEILTNICDVETEYTVINYMCKTHGVQKMRISNFLNGKRCPKCLYDKNRERFKLSYDEVDRRVSSCGGTLLNKKEYINSQKKNLKIICSECGDVFVTSLSKFMQHGGQVCPTCSPKESMGERKIRHFLENSSIYFEQEKCFTDCRDKRPLPFDFYIPDFSIVIEYHGKQHYSRNTHLRSTLEQIQKHDSIKNKYCESNKIKLIRIPYWDYRNIEEILYTNLNLHEDIV